MKKKTGRFDLLLNGKKHKSYSTYGSAICGLESLYNNAKVLPFDTVSIYDKINKCFVYG